MPAPRPFAVDLDELDRVLARMAACERDLHDLADQVSRTAGRLHTTWEGESAAAHAVAQRSWESRFERMREALTAMRAAGRTAHGNYAAAAAANTDMWARL